MVDTRQKDWTNILFLTLSPIIGVFGTAAYAIQNGVRWWEPLLCLFFFLAVGFAITAGYHRLWSHQTYEAHPVVQCFYLFFGALALQNSVLNWCSDHRNHHRYVDRDWDPYNIKRGGWYAHIVWIFYKARPDKSFDNVPDLKKNRLVMFQHRYGTYVGILAGLGIPTLIGAFFGRPLGGLLWGGFLRIVLIHHTTFFVNSISHLYGTRPYTDENSARDHWLLAIVTNGEGYHNFHHKFPSDFRNGIKWYHWDPGKWLIRALQSAGLARHLTVTPQPIIEKARLSMLVIKIEPRLARVPSEIAQAFRTRMDEARQSLERASALWQEAQLKHRERLAAGRRRSALLREAWGAKRHEYEQNLLRARQQWREAIEMLSKVPQV
jgi:stearoyl-CoA desaturase (Delta-9 desaturase)